MLKQLPNTHNRDLLGVAVLPQHEHICMHKHTIKENELKQSFVTDLM